MTTQQSITGYAPVHKGQLYYEVSGAGKPVLFIHAGVADHTMWDKQFNLFGQNFKVIRFDSRGYGKSHTETTEFSNRQDILDLLNHIGVDKVAVIGISRGGQIAIDFTVEHPERVSALVAVAAGISGYEYDPGDNEQSQRETELFNTMEALWDKNAFDELTELEVHAWADGPLQPDGRAPAQIRDYIRKIVRSNFDRQDGEATPKPLDPPAVTRLGDIHQPVLIMVGEYDTHSTLAAADEMECRIPLSRKVGFPDTAHMIPLEKPEKFNEIVLGFLNEVL